MTEPNPYATPKSDVSAPQNRTTDERMEKMATGQKLVIYAVLLYFVSAGLRLYIGPLAVLPVLVSLIMSLVGLYKVLAARQSHIVVKIILFVLLFVPLINILVLLSINSRATKALREAGYTVGFMGASKA
ncbi:hypothetical protein GCM10008090_32890 [Arenicella chitinivorans]|uniref:Uncharacterized protein n=1 Tax=Arenicella chitinivorans TaxID=1329800 RepID=A0A918S2X8_9GAMM|nr:hypothetical protein [Arenicella chitinivorans]GHA20309.1 hypothetical protein GCM10008090_32890 [Arenicella chitinivorans]